MSRELVLKLAREGWITRWQIENALQAQLIYKGPLLVNLIKLGYISENKALRFCSHIYRIPIINAERLENVPDAIIDLIPADFVKEWRAVPVGTKNGELLLAVPYPPSAELLGNISFFVGMNVRPVLVSEQAQAKAIRYYYAQSITTVTPESAPEEQFLPPEPPEDSGYTEADESEESTTASEQDAYGEKGDSQDKTPEQGAPEGDQAAPAHVEDTLRVPAEREAGDLQHVSANEQHETTPGELLENLSEQLSFAETRDEIIDTASRWFGDHFGSVVFLTIKKTQAIGYRISGEPPHMPQAKELELSLNLDSLLKSVATEKLAESRDANGDTSVEYVSKALGYGDAPAALAVPVVIKERSIGIFLALAPKDAIDWPKDYWVDVQHELSSAFEAMILSKKIGV